MHASLAVCNIILGMQMNLIIWIIPHQAAYYCLASLPYSYTTMKVTSLIIIVSSLLISTVCECQPINPPTRKPTPKPIAFTKSSKTKSSKSTSCTSSKSSKSSRRRRSSRRRCSKSSKSSSSSFRRIEPPTDDASIRRSPDRDTYEFDSEDGSI